jgi:SAM-dependent methyltransferase
MIGEIEIMAHAAQQEFIKKIVNNFPNHFSGKVLDIGSLDINGDITHHFVSAEYIGVDVGPGRNVNLVARGEDLELASNYFDVVIYGECLEHNPAWKGTFSNMFRMVLPGGLVVMTCASTLRTEHGTTRSDLGSGAPLSVEQGFEYYKNLAPRHLRAVIDVPMFSNFKIFQNWAESDLYFVGIKVDKTEEFVSEWSQTLTELKSLVRGFNKPKRIVKLQYGSLEWRWKLKIVRKAREFLGEVRYQKLRKVIRILGV